MKMFKKVENSMQALQIRHERIDWNFLVFCVESR